jgi:hypothetical protein
MSKDNICVYPSQCQFPSCNCDQPHKAEKHFCKPVIPSTDFASRYGIKGNPFDNRYKEFSTASKPVPKDDPYADLSKRIDERIKELNQTSDPKNRHGCDYLDCGCQAPCTTTNTVRERFVIYVGTLHLSKSEAEKHVREVKSKIVAENDTALWYVIADPTTAVSRIVRV